MGLFNLHTDLKRKGLLLLCLSDEEAEALGGSELSRPQITGSETWLRDPVPVLFILPTWKDGSLQRRSFLRPLGDWQGDSLSSQQCPAPGRELASG